MSSTTRKKRRGVNKIINISEYSATISDNLRLLSVDYCEERTPKLRLDTEFIDFITRQAEKLRIYINFRKTPYEKLCLYEAKLELCLMLLEIAEYNEHAFFTPNRIR